MWFFRKSGVFASDWCQVPACRGLHSGGGGGETSECLCILCVSLFKIDLTFQSGCRVTAKSSQKYRVPVHCLSPTPRPVRAVFTARFEDALALTATHARATHSLGERP